LLSLEEVECLLLQFIRDYNGDINSEPNQVIIHLEKVSDDYNVTLSINRKTVKTEKDTHHGLSKEKYDFLIANMIVCQEILPS